ncbi:MAG: TIGR04141 family sporadically distributed protein [Alphaproteobacteria bacterium]|nr:TIGR04141 family sporadically distributed protein [Alphaproteobacteria bacterium]
MVYGLGYWDVLLNPNSIIPQWGLRLATSGYICNPNRIKELHADHYRTSNPFSRREKAADLQPIEVFGVEVGSEELKKVALMPNKSVKTQHVIEGADHVQFTINPSDKATPEQTLHSLNAIALHFFTLTTDSSFRIHSRMREFIDDEITDARLPLLNQYLEMLFRPSQKVKKSPKAKTPKAKEKFFLHNTLWAKMKSKKLTFGEKKGEKHCIFDVFSQLTPQDPFPQTIKIWTPRAKTAKEFDVRWLFYSLPLKYDGGFYRFDRGHWYRVDDSRFESIKRILRQVKQPSNTLSLPSYSIEDTKRDVDQKKADYKEAKYNLRAAQEIKKKAGWEAILLDRINVSLGEAGDKFEFADLLVRYNNVFHIVHVKRAKASQLSHHREQVERSADFLATELTKGNAHTLFLQGIINGLYETSGLPIKKEKKQGTRITKGNLFLNLNQSQANFRKKPITTLLQVKKEDKKLLKTFKQQIDRIIDKAFFQDYSHELVSALDALFDCVVHKKVCFNDSEVEEFLNAVKQGIMARQLLFPKGPLKKSDLKNIKIVLAVIDDRAVEATLKGERQKAPQEAIFRNQHLWGLDRTRAMVEKTGLGFTLMVINEVATETEDAFGRIVKKERKESFIDMSGDEPELLPASYPIKTEAFFPLTQPQPNSSEQEESADDHEEFPEKQDVAGYQYTSTDINRLLHVPLSQNHPQEANYVRFSLSGGADDAEADTNDIVHRLNNRYVLPPVISHKDEHEEKSPSEALVDLLTNSFFTHPQINGHPPVEMIIPFNPGGHWVTFHIVIPPEGDITFRYIDSLPDMPTREARLPLAFLKGKYFPRTINFELSLSRIQPDGTSCGAVTVENIKGLFHENSLPDPHLINLVEMLTLKEGHRAYLHTIGKDFDF